MTSNFDQVNILLSFAQFEREVIGERIGDKIADSKKKGRAFTTTMGASQDFESEGLRRLLVNGCYWAAGLEDKIAEKSQVDLVGKFEARPFRGGGFKKGVKPEDLKME